jgi:Tfp pilus assembly protein PilN
MINLLPAQYKEQVRFGRYNVRLRWYVGLVLVVFAGMTLTLLGANWYAGSELRRLEGELGVIEEQLGPVRTLSEEAKQIATKLKTLKELFAKETNYVALLEDIEKTIVKGAQLQQLELTGDETKPLEMRFIINDKLVAATLRNSLEQSDRFKFVDIQDITESDTESGPQIIVTYKLSYEPGKGR